MVDSEEAAAALAFVSAHCPHLPLFARFRADADRNFGLIRHRLAQWTSCLVSLHAHLSSSAQGHGIMSNSAAAFKTALESI
jgi:hypothetical protein